MFTYGSINGLPVTMDLLRPAVTAHARRHTGVYIGGTLLRGHIGVGVTKHLCTTRGANPTSTFTPPYSYAYFYTHLPDTHE